MSGLVTRLEAWRLHCASCAATLGATPLRLLAGGFISGLAAIPAIALHRYGLALLLILLSRSMTILARPVDVARDAGPGASFDLILLAGIPFAFALSDPSAALAASLLLFALVAACAVTLFESPGRGIAAPDIAVCTGGYVLACAMPQHFGLVAYILSLAAFAAAGARIAVALTRSGS